MRVHVADHPLITHKLTVLRDKTTSSPTFRALTEELVTLLAYEATRNVRVETVTVQTPVAETQGVAIALPRPLVVPILRAGLGMLEGMVKLVPTAEVGFLGMVRNEETLQPDIYAERPLRDHVVYCMSKAALLAGTRALALELAPEVRVNAIAPGAILWPEEGKPEAAKAALLARTPLGRIGTPEEIADAVRWLLQGAAYTTGQVIRVDGGRLLDH